MSKIRRRPNGQPIKKVTLHSLTDGQARKRKRVGPRGRPAIVSDDAIESIVAEIEKQTRKAINIIGRSTGF